MPPLPDGRKPALPPLPPEPEPGTPEYHRWLAEPFEIPYDRPPATERVVPPEEPDRPSPPPAGTTEGRGVGTPAVTTWNKELEELEDLSYEGGGRDSLVVCLELRPTIPDYLGQLFRNSDWLRTHAREDWQGELFQFVRWVKAHPEMTGRGAEAAWEEVARAVPGRAWGRFGVTAEDAEVQFLANWNRVYSLPTEGPLKLALRLADARPLPIPPKLRGRSSGYRRFLSLAAYLQRGSGGSPIYFTNPKVGGLLGVSPSAVDNYRRWAEKDKFLRVERPGHIGQPTLYRFDLSRFPELTEE